MLAINTGRHLECIKMIEINKESSGAKDGTRNGTLNVSKYSKAIWDATLSVLE